MRVNAHYTNLSPDYPETCMSDDQPSIRSYLGQNGVVGIFVRLEPPDGMIFGELEDSIYISSRPLKDRLRTGENLDLITQTWRAGDHGNAKRYVLTERGEAIRERIVEIELDRTYSLYVEAYNTLVSQRGEIQEWLDESDVTEPWWPQGPEPDDDLPGT